ncbi:MAG: DNA alkylation repair protein [Candidatus Bathyarchaeia archaeon]
MKRVFTDNRNFVKKVVSWALRQIGKRNLRLTKKQLKLQNGLLLMLLEN